MSPRGSPDHTIITHTQHIHYVSKTLTFPSVNITTLVDWTEILNVDIQGVFGWLWWASEDPDCYMRLTIDGVRLYAYTIQQMFTMGLSGAQNPFRKIAVTRYDVAEEKFNCVYDEEWGLYVHENLTVELTYEIGSAGKASASVHYKQIKA